MGAGNEAPLRICRGICRGFPSARVCEDCTVGLCSTSSTFLVFGGTEGFPDLSWVRECIYASPVLHLLQAQQGCLVVSPRALCSGSRVRTRVWANSKTCSKKGPLARRAAASSAAARKLLGSCSGVPRECLGRDLGVTGATGSDSIFLRNGLSPVL